ncbi:MAG: transposase, partial [Thermodesulfobacteriota bacterium]|nr:transposase [Thermodesulfobacteriota bacterium]
MYKWLTNLLQPTASRYSFGLVICFCLSLGIQPIFIPIKEPWRNGIIERFQNVFDKMFFRAQYFESFSYLVQQARGFETFHNHNHRYRTMEGKTPVEKVSGELKYLQKDFRLPKKVSIIPGYIHLIRFIRSRRILD